MGEQPIKVLLADDDETVRMLVVATLESIGLEVVAAADGQEAVERFRAGEFGAVILDLHMPRLGGLEALAHFRKIEPRVPALILSGSAAGAQRATEARVGSFVAKPFTPSELLRELRVVLSGTAHGGAPDRRVRD